MFLVELYEGFIKLETFDYDRYYYFIPDNPIHETAALAICRRIMEVTNKLTKTTPLFIRITVRPVPGELRLAHLTAACIIEHLEDYMWRFEEAHIPITIITDGVKPC